MATALTRFEVRLPSLDDPNVLTFLTNMRTLCELNMYTTYVYPVGGTGHDGTLQVNIIYGLVTTAQQSTALGYLTTLNAALGQNVLCTVNGVTQEP